jgi:transcriptional regulator with XRE-family HTH domain
MARRTPAYAPVVRYLRQAAGMTVADLARRLGVADYYIGYLENGYRWPRPPLLAALARAFGWEPFELALVADVEIPYPEWPGLHDLDGWRRLAHEWSAVVDAITRYALAREVLAHPEWPAALDPDLPAAVAEYGLVAVYAWIRARWVPATPHPDRLRAPETPDDVRAALAAGAAGAPVVREPAFLEGLSPQDRATLEAVAESLRHRPR